jgi:hypothetical protein
MNNNCKANEQEKYENIGGVVSLSQFMGSDESNTV